MDTNVDWFKEEGKKLGKLCKVDKAIWSWMENTYTWVVGRLVYMIKSLHGWTTRFVCIDKDMIITKFRILNKGDQKLFICFKDKVKQVLGQIEGQKHM